MYHPILLTAVAMKASHAAINLKLRHAVALAQKDMATFVQDTSLYRNFPLVALP